MKVKQTRPIKLQNKRLFIFLSIMVLIAILLSFSSSIFHLKHIDFYFYNNINERIPLQLNSVFNSNKKIEEVLTQANLQMGQSIFTTSKQNIWTTLEHRNPYLKILKIESVFPNTFIIHAKERQPMFFISSIDKIFYLDLDFKILQIANKIDNNKNIKISFYNNSNLEETFFTFFNISSQAFSKGQFLTENNLVFQELWKIQKELNSDILNSISAIDIKKNKQQDVDIILKTKQEYGIVLEIHSILENFTDKLSKIQEALFTLKKNEPIKTTYGRLVIDENLNCFWHKL